MDNDDQEVENPGGGMANGANGANGQYPEQQHLEDDDLSSSEHGEEHGEDAEEDRNDLLAQSILAPNAQPALDALAQATSSPMAHLNNLLAIHPQLLAKFNMEPITDPELHGRSLEALQLVMNSGNFNVPNMLFGMPSMYRPQQSSLQQQNMQQQSNLQPQSLQNSTSPIVNTVATQALVPCSSTQSGDSPKSTRSNGESYREVEPHESRESREPHAAANSQQMPNWSFEDQFKQVRQLYEIDENPKRKIFLDELFGFMTNRGTPINRLPIMAKSVLDLYELYNLVVARGGLVEVINKKLWQEIIKGLHLPSSITSAAFTLRSQYMKYLYPYERFKENLSTQDELTAAVESNRREGRRSSYVAFGSNNINENLQSAIQQRNHAQNPLALHHSMPLSLAAQMAAATGGPSALIANGRPHTPLQPHQPHPSSLGSMSQEFHMLKVFNQDVRNIISVDPTMLQRHSSASSPTAMPETLSKVDYKLNLWNMYNNNKLYPSLTQLPLSPSAPTNSPEEPQKEALDLASSTLKSEHPNICSPPAVNSPLSSNAIAVKKNYNDTSCSPSKRFDEDETLMIDGNNSLRVNQSILVRDGGRKQLRMSVDINGVIYKGVLAATNDNNSATSSSPVENDATDNMDNAKSSQNISS